MQRRRRCWSAGRWRGGYADGTGAKADV